MPGEHDNERPGAVARHQQFSRLMCGSFVGRFSPSNQIGESNLAVAWRSAMHSSCCRGVFSFKGGTTINSVFVSARYVVALAAAVLCTSTTSGGDRSGLRLQLAGGGRLGKSRWPTTGTSSRLAITDCCCSPAERRGKPKCENSCSCVQCSRSDYLWRRLAAGSA